MMFRDFVTYRIVRDKCVQDCNYTDDELCDWRKTKCKWINDLDFIRETFSEWLENGNTKLSRDNYMNMGVAMEASHVITDGYVSWISFDGSKYSDMAEQFWNWIDKNKSIFTADDYFEMEYAV